MQSVLFGDQFQETQTTDLMVVQNQHLVKVNLDGTIHAKQGSMVAYQGEVNFKYKGAGAKRLLKKLVSGEDFQLMEITGKGDVFLADTAQDVYLVFLENEALSIKGDHVLALDAALSWDIKFNRLAGMLAGGLVNVIVSGTGWVALTSHGVPVVLQVDRPTLTDINATVAWSTSLDQAIKKSDSMFKTAIGRGGGELFQMSFSGDGHVIVQPSEGFPVAPSSG